MKIIFFCNQNKNLQTKKGPNQFNNGLVAESEPRICISVRTKLLTYLPNALHGNITIINTK